MNKRQQERQSEEDAESHAATLCQSRSGGMCSAEAAIQCYCVWVIYIYIFDEAAPPPLQHARNCEVLHVQVRIAEMLRTIMLLVIVSLIIHYYVITYDHVITEMNNENTMCQRERAVSLSSLKKSVRI